ncbi:MAG: hypothetical protein LBR00_00295 [Clostridiales Family XIII bacterium]|jgi:hypothetical protein|nr:hypothetical protein [Clostridiales Family XIII bacterium]
MMGLAYTYEAEVTLFYILFFVLLTFWAYTMFLRIADKQLRGDMLWACALVIVLLLLRIADRMTPDAGLQRYLGYFYYIPLIFVPTIAGRMGLRISDADRTWAGRVYGAVSIAVGLALFALVITNDLHGLAFDYYEGFADPDVYRYGIVYQIHTVRAFWLLLLFVGLAVRKFWPHHRRSTVPVLATLAAIILYFTGFSLKVPAFRNTDFSLIFGISTLILLEVMLRSGFLQNNVRYMDLFRYAKVDVHLFSSGLRPAFSTDAATPLSPALLARVEEAVSAGAPLPAPIAGDDARDVRHTLYRVQGGYALSTVSLARVAALREKLDERRKRLSDRNEYLSHTGDILRRQAQLAASREVYEKLRADLAGRREEFDRMLSSLPERFEARTRKEWLGNIVRIKGLVNYWKRRGGLALQEAAGETVEIRSLALWAEEAFFEVSAAGFAGGVSCRENRQVPAAVAALAYDLFFHALDSALQDGAESMLVSVAGGTEERPVCALRIVVDDRLVVRLEEPL